MQDNANARLNMVNSQLLTNKLTDDRITQALLAVPRENFVPKALRGVAYIDEDIALGDGRYLMEPMAFARMLQAAEIAPSDVVLDVACAGGYSTTVLAQLASTVVGLEVDDVAVAAAEAQLAAMNVDNAAVVAGELREGCADQGPYDVIFVNGAVAEVPEAFAGQLAKGGRIVVVERQGPVSQAILYCNRDGLLSRRELFDVMIPVLPSFQMAEEFQF
ncbi:MAG: protein-L-isoaspartate O-methyltransferase [Alphaproteobacteria bacterium]|jgi:protein-L-isoaspartate(D-aspartate) O-methyltransferase|nr:protein-L-isoaspartate O-methyltransferase [Rhodospirillaceae bacterium]MDP6023686.1 protein-L-isoaspartate O-methyltransferase [Alphaproteobacteria bacterium]MDP6253904.1 protein-L-isoaspartate O-methyltransferase [Alphaproteobacteria bacterium]MDP7053046.1 protein-L-isoaspartate O-methyltransferase [Alphaproteobacteria bacterium]MDP7228973.1 protein-L-isoaspartate O-methyltransferase [Alphaproteobacteria bacterium]|tara:strand:- start:3857 stop:4510 length:654 start_codon:yes stop_codon:yes gene_type:complete